MSNTGLTKVFIVDDSRDAVEVLRHRLENRYSVNIVGTAYDANSAVDMIIKTEPDLLFLDIELPTMTGLELYTLIRNELKPETKVVFYTGHDKYMLEAIRKQAFDYLLKPPTEQDVAQLMTRYYENKLGSLPPAGNYSSHLPIILVLDSFNQHITLKLEDIAYFCYNQERRQWKVVCVDNTNYILRHRTTADIILNYSSELVQIHKRYIVNINHIQMIQNSICVMKVPEGEDTFKLNISKNYRSNLMQVFFSL